MSNQRQYQKQQALREAEGYLDLLAIGSRFQLNPSSRNRLAQRAISVIERIGDCDVWQAHSLYLRGQALRITERYSDAILPLEAAAKMDRGNVHIWLALAWCQKRCNRIDLAIEALEEAGEIDGSQAIIFYNLACYWALARNVRRCVNNLTRAFELDCNYRDRVGDEADFDPIRHHPFFQVLTTVIV